MAEGSQYNSTPQNQQKEGKGTIGEYPVSESFKVLEGYDILRSPNFIVALVAVEAASGRDLRLYRWQKRNNQWKVDLCRMSVASWQWDDIASKAKELSQKYNIQKRHQRES